MRDFEYYAPTRVIFGKDTHYQIGQLLKERNCQKVLIHYGGNSALSSGLLEEVKTCLKESGIDFVTLGGVVPNPRLSKVREGIALCKKEGVDFLLAVGGGSVIDYLDVRLFSFAVFNFADCCVVVGVILFAIYLFFFDGKKKSAKQKEETA